MNLLKLILSGMMAAGLSACGSAATVGAIATGIGEGLGLNENGSSVACNDVCRLMSASCVVEYEEEGEPDACSDSQMLYEACAAVCTESGSRANADLLYEMVKTQTEESCRQAQGFLGLSC